MKVYTPHISMILCLMLALLTVSPGFAAKKQDIPQLVPGQPSPRVFLQAASHGNQWTARRDQSLEMSKDFGRTCPAIQINVNPAMADYTIVLNHLEVGLSRNNQLQIAAKNGDQLAMGEGGSINGRVKQACILILTNWNTNWNARSQ
jgi:hypothetical protein